MKRFFQIGPVAASIDMPENCPLPQTLALFERGEMPVDVAYTIEFGDQIVQEAERLIARAESALPRESILVLQLPEGEGRVICHTGSNVPYAIYQEMDEKHVRILADEKIRQALEIETLFVSMLALEKREIFAGAMVLHSAYIVHEGQAILFTAPSETGKSTQAGLWEKYRGARQVNGDCSLLRKIDGVWYACGWPTCGSSQICHDEHYPIRAVVVLFQAKENTVAPLRGFKALRPVMEQIKINMWNGRFQEEALTLIEDLVTKVPVFHQGCDISEEAVMCLYEALEGLK